MPRYTANVSATTNSSGGTEDSFIELTTASGSAACIKKFCITIESAASDDTFSYRFVRKSAAGATGTGFTPVKKDPAFRASSATCNVKNGTNAFTTGTVTDVIQQGAVNGRGYYEWLPAKKEEEIIIVGSSFGGLLVKCSAASKVIRCEMDWED